MRDLFEDLAALAAVAGLIFIVIYAAPLIEALLNRSIPA